MRKSGAYWVFAAHRVSGIALAAFLPLHFWVLADALQLDTLLGWADRPLLKLSESVIVLALAAHLGTGVRVLVLEFLPWRGWHKGLAAAAAAGVIAAGLGFALAL